MLPSMPIIFTPMKDKPSQPSTSVINTNDADTSDPALFETKEERISLSSPEIEHGAGSIRYREQTPPKASGSPLSFSMKKSSPLKLVNPILKKYNTHRQGKIMKRSVSPMHNPSHLSYAQTYFLHSDNFELGSHVEEEDGNGDNEADLQALMAASSTVPSTPKGKKAPSNRKKRLKEIRDAKVMLTLLTPDSEQYNAENARNFAQAYYHKLQEQLKINGEEELFEHILQLLGEFEAKTMPITELYEKVVTSLHGYPDLAELFIMFLLPEQAVECGKFMEYVKLTNMKTFIRKLETFFAKLPQQFRHILATLTTLSEQPDLTINQVKSAIKPLLRGNSYLEDSFLFLFPSERPPDSLMTDFEEMEVDSDDHSGDEEESVLIPDQEDNYGTDNCVCLCHSSDMQKYATRHLHCFSCGTKFIHGKVYVHIGRVLRPAKVSFPGFSDEIIQQRLGVKTCHKARRKNSYSPSKTPLDGHCDEKCDTDEEPKSSSPKSCKIAKPKMSSPTSKLHTNGLKQSFNGCKCDTTDGNNCCNEEHPTEDPVHHCSVNDTSEILTSTEPVRTTDMSSSLTDTTTVPSTIPYSSTNIALPTFVSQCVDETTVVQQLTEQNITSSDVFQNDLSCDDNISIGSDIDFYTCNNTTDTNTPLIIGNAYSTKVFSDSVNNFQMSLTLMDTTKDENITLESMQSLEFTNNLDSPVSLRADTPDIKHLLISLPESASTNVHQSSASTSNEVCSTDTSTSDAENSPLKAEFIKDELSKSLLVDPYLVAPVITSDREPGLLTSTEMTNLYLKNHQSRPNSTSTDTPTSTSVINDHATFTEHKVKDDHSFSTISKNVLSSMGFNYDNLKFSPMRNSPTSNDCFPSTNDPSLLLGSTTDCLSFLEQMSDSSSSTMQNIDCLTSYSPNNEPSSTSLNNDCLTLTFETDSEKLISNPSDDGVRPWTREEDRLILVQVQLGLALDESFNNVQKLLPHREIQEIRERFQVLMKILQEMTNLKGSKDKNATSGPNSSTTS